MAIQQENDELKEEKRKMEENQELRAQFDSVICGDDPRVRAGKPAPDIFLAAAKELGVDPARCIAFEDTPTGCRAAVAAGMQTIAIPDFSCGNVDVGAFPGAVVLRSMDDFDPVAYGLPPLPM